MKKILFVFVLLIAFTAQAQWTPNTAINTPVAGVVTDDMQSLTGPSGRSYSAMFQPGTMGYDFRLQILDNQGVPLKGTNGIIIDNTTAMSTSTVTWDFRLDAAENIYIGFTGTANYDAVAHKLDSAGNHIWSTSGVALGSGYDVKLLPLNSGQVLAGWLDASGAGAKIRMISATGSFAWTNPVSITSPSGSGSVNVGEMMEYSNGDMLVIFYVRPSFGPYAIAYAQRYTSTGGTVWTAPVALSSWYIPAFRRHPLFAHGDTAFFGMAASLGSDLQCMVQRLNPGGGLPWGATGKDVSSQNTNYERWLTMGIPDDGDHLYVAAEITPPSQGSTGTMLQKIRLRDGATPWGSSAKIIFPISSKDQSPYSRMGFLNEDPIFLYTDGFNNGGSPIRLLAAHADTAGNLIDSLAMGTYSAPKGRIQMGGVQNNRVTATWTESRGSGTMPFAHRLDLTPCLSPSAAGASQSLLDSAWFNYSGTAADSLYWDFGDGSGSSASVSDTLSHSYSANGTYPIELRAYVNCGKADSLSWNLVISGIGLDEGPFSRAVMYPNPNEGRFTLVTGDSYFGASYDIFDATGRSIDHGPIESRNQSFDLSMRPKGIYHLRIQSQSTSDRLVIVIR